MQLSYHTQWNNTNDKHLQDAILKITAQYKQYCNLEKAIYAPHIYSYYLKPHIGIKYNNIIKLKNEFIGALGIQDVRIYQNKQYIVLEVPNIVNNTVLLGDILHDNHTYDTVECLYTAVGINTQGQPIIADIAQMPHLLIAGTTGSGKSVFIQGLIISLLLKHTCKNLQLYLIDPKMVEFAPYQRIRGIAVITEVSQALDKLQTLCREMDRRYKLMSKRGCRNIDAYNSTSRKKLFKIICIIDELADLMLTSKKQAENYIVRLAQKARACGIHLVIATQRPTVNVVTGLIKANITTRICFATASGVDSRVMLDRNGAEKLLGKGDMLYKPSNSTELQRLQGAYISDQEINTITTQLRKR